jgi:ATP-binding cassette subfamily B protein
MTATELRAGPPVLPSEEEAELAASYTRQDAELFNESIRDNIAYGRPDATDADVEDALRALGLLDRFVDFPDGLETEVRERGSRLSAGERQLVSLARAALADPSVLVLDEATSNLDLKSETQVEAGLDALLQGRTAIIVAHRLSTAMRADRIAVLDDGRIAELGSHEELVARGGRYAEMYAAWVEHAGSPEGLPSD